MFDPTDDIRVISAFSKTINILSVMKTAMTVGIIAYCVFTSFKGVSALEGKIK